MRRLTDSALGLTLIVVTLLTGLAGLVTSLLSVGDPVALYGAAIVMAITAISTTLDEHHQQLGKFRWTEVLFGRALVTLAIVLDAVAFVLAIGDSPSRNLWLVLAIVTALLGLTAVLDSHRLATVRARRLPTHDLADGILAAICASLGFGFGTFGFVSGELNDPRAASWLYGGVVFALISVALMFDERAHVASQARKNRWLGP